MPADLVNLKAQVEQARKGKGIDLNVTLNTAGSSPPTNCAKACAAPRRVLKGHFGKVYAQHWGGTTNGGQNSDNLVSASQDGKLIIWDALSTAKVSAVPLRSSWVMTCGMEPTSGRMVACGGLDNTCSVYKVSAGGLPPPPIELQGHDGYLSCCRFISEANILTSSGDSNCILWDIETKKEKQKFGDHKGDVMALDLSKKDSNLFATGSCDTSVKLWDLRVGDSTGNRSVITFNDSTLDDDNAFESDVNAVSFHPSGNAIVGGSDDSTARLFDIRCCQQVMKYHESSILCGVTSACISQTGRIIFAAYDDSDVRAWDAVSGKSLGNLGGAAKAHSNRVSCIDINATGQALSTGSWDTFVKVWA